MNGLPFFSILIIFQFLGSKYCQASGIIGKHFNKRHQFTSLHQFIPYGLPPVPNSTLVACSLKCLHSLDCNAYTFDEDTDKCVIGKFDYGHDLNILDPEIHSIWTEEQGIKSLFNDPFRNILALQLNLLCIQHHNRCWYILKNKETRLLYK